MQPLHILLQEADDEHRSKINSDILSEGFHGSLHVYKSFHLMEWHFFLHLPDVIIFNWQYPQQLCFDFIAKAKNAHPAVVLIVTFDFVQPDFFFQLQQLGVQQCLVKPFDVVVIFTRTAHLLLTPNSITILIFLKIKYDCKHS